MSEKTYAVYGRNYRSADEIARRLDEIDRAHPGGRLPKQVSDEAEGLRATLGDIDAEARMGSLRSFARDPRNREAGTHFPDRAGSADEDSSPQFARAAREGALRTLEAHVSAGRLESRAADNVDAVLRGPDKDLGLDAAYIEAAGSPCTSGRSRSCSATATAPSCA
jgi:hypothetical protein